MKKDLIKFKKKINKKAKKIFLFISKKHKHIQRQTKGDDNLKL